MVYFSFHFEMRNRRIRTFAARGLPHHAFNHQNRALVAFRCRSVDLGASDIRLSTVLRQCANAFTFVLCVNPITSVPMHAA
jgi:hypothetical protein